MLVLFFFFFFFFRLIYHQPGVQFHINISQGVSPIILFHIIRWSFSVSASDTRKSACSSSADSVFETSSFWSFILWRQFAWHVKTYFWKHIKNYFKASSAESFTNMLSVNRIANTFLIDKMYILYCFAGSQWELRIRTNNFKILIIAAVKI